MTVAQRYARWAKAVEAKQESPDSENWQELDREEQEAWDDMADHDDPEYVRIVES